MKKWIIVAIAFICLASLSACRKADKSNVKEPEKKEVEITRPQEDIKSDAAVSEGDSTEEAQENSSIYNKSKTTVEIEDNVSFSTEQNKDDTMSSNENISSSKDGEDEIITNEHRYDKDGDGFVDGWY